MHKSMNIITKGEGVHKSIALCNKVHEGGVHVPPMPPLDPLLELYWGPLSLRTVSGIPCRENTDLIASITAAVVVDRSLTTFHHATCKPLSMQLIVAKLS